MQSLLHEADVTWPRSNEVGVWDCPLLLWNLETCQEWTRLISGASTIPTEVKTTWLARWIYSAAGLFGPHQRAADKTQWILLSITQLRLTLFSSSQPAATTSFEPLSGERMKYCPELYYVQVKSLLSPIKNTINVTLSITVQDSACIYYKFKHILIKVA